MMINFDISNITLKYSCSYKIDWFENVKVRRKILFLNVFIDKSQLNKLNLIQFVGLDEFLLENRKNKLILNKSIPNIMVP